MVQIEFEVGSVIQFDPTQVHVEYAEMLSAWTRSRDAVDGGVRIKDKGKTYLPVLNSRQTTKDYNDYRDRAYWFGATGKTVGTFLSMMFRRPPVIDFVTDEDADDDEIREQSVVVTDFLKRSTSDSRSHEAVIREIVKEVLIVNRVGALEDFPPAAVDEDGAVIVRSQLQTEEMGLRSFTAIYKTEAIINWKIEEVDGQRKPTLFVLHEIRDEAEPVDALWPKEEDVYRILYLFREESGEVVYKQAVLVQDRPTKKVSKRAAKSRARRTFRVEEVTTPLKDNTPMSEIPFWIINADGIDYEDVDTPVIYDLAEVNIAHYRNTADFERELHYIAIRTAIFPGWDKGEFGEPEIGGALASPPDQKPYIMESSSTSPIKEEMGKKEERMAILGAQLLAQRGRYVEAEKTALLHSRGESSVVASIARSVSAAMTVILRFKLEWSGLDPRELSVAINTDFDEMKFDSEDLKPLMELLQVEAISFDVFFYALQQMEMYPPDWTKQKEIDAIITGRDELFGGATGSRIEALETTVAGIQAVGNEPPPPAEPPGEG